MKNLKKTLAVGTMVLALGTASTTVFAAANYKTPAEAVAGITGRTVESVIAERVETGKTYGTIAAEAGKLDEYKTESLEMKKDNLNAQVAAGTITQEKADTIIKAIEENQVVCDGTGVAKIGQNLGAKFNSNGTGQGTGCTNRSAETGIGQGRGAVASGRGMGVGGMGLQDGSCYVNMTN